MPSWLPFLRLRLLSAERTAIGPWWDFRSVISPFARLYLVAGGEAFIHLEGRRHHLRPGCMALIPAHLPCDYRCPEAMDLHHLCCTGEAGEGVDLFPTLRCPWVLDARAVAIPAMTAAFLRLEAINPDRGMRSFDPFQRDGRIFTDDGGPLAAAADPVRWLESDGLLRQLLAPFLVQAEDRPPLDERLAGVLALIERHLDRPPSVRACARAAGLAPTWFSDRFATALGVRPAAWIERRRIRQAQLLLATSDLPIKGVAARLGYGQAPHFARVFRRVTGLSPGEYRRHLGLRPLVADRLA